MARKNGLDDNPPGNLGLFMQESGVAAEREAGTLTLPGADAGAPYGTDPYVYPIEESAPTEGLPVYEPPPVLDAVVVADTSGPVRDRLWPHLIWEVVLAAGCATTALLLFAQDDKVFRGDAGPALMLWVATAVLLGSAASLSLRAGLPNLAIGAIAIGAGADYAWLLQVDGRPFLTALGMVLAGGALVGLVIALFATALGVPSWAVGLGVAAVLSGAVPALAGSQVRSLSGTGTPDVGVTAQWWLAGAAAVSVLGGLLLTFGPLRRFVGLCRPAGDPAKRAGFAASIAAAGALVGSGVLAAAAGVLDAANRGSSPAGYTGMAELALVGFSVALLGGVSAHGRRGGIFGVLLAGVLIGLVRLYLDLHNADKWTGAVVSGLAILLGLAVTRLVERLGRVRASEPRRP
jgi:ribose/xylose/arabinose/galactoside ABC-type transport system permease subunit